MPREHDAHYLHDKRGLSVLVRPPVSGVAWMGWDGTGHLLVATTAGSVVRVHPAMGTRTILQGRPPPLGLGVDGDRFVLVEEGGGWTTFDLSGVPMIVADHPFTGPVAVQFREGKVLLTGATPEGKQVLFYDSGRKVLRIQLPPKAIGFISSGFFGLAQSTPVGLETIFLRDGGRFHGREHTPHQLEAHADHILGLHTGGVRAWSLIEGEYTDIHLPGVTCVALSVDGRVLAAGTKHGEVAMVDLDGTGERRQAEVVEASSEPIRTISFSPTGNYLATGADGLILWTWGPG